MTTSLARSAFDSLLLDAVPDHETLRQTYAAPSDAAVPEADDRTHRPYPAVDRLPRRWP
ncbi:hypothetical protein [Streptomyces sp. KL116D]|uniref:hypothetical protein n=1 Tax=Streptomyces sp. KL116D TaxID=3045152 RepID=UPI003556F0BB